MADNAGLACAAVCCLVVLLLVIILPLSIRRLEENEFGLEYNRISKRLDDEPKSGGLFPGPPGFKFIKFPST